jgi:hypothetical protein
VADDDDDDDDNNNNTILHIKKQLCTSDNWSFIKPFQYDCNDFHMTCAICSRFIRETSVAILL